MWTIYVNADIDEHKRNPKKIAQDPDTKMIFYFGVLFVDLFFLFEIIDPPAPKSHLNKSFSASNQLIELIENLKEAQTKINKIGKIFFLFNLASPLNLVLLKWPTFEWRTVFTEHSLFEQSV